MGRQRIDIATVFANAIACVNAVDYVYGSDTAYASVNACATAYGLTCRTWSE